MGSSRVSSKENISVPLELTCFFGSKTLGLFPFFEPKFPFPRSNGPFSRSGLPKSRFAQFWQLSDLEKGPFDLGNENFALRNETSPASFSTSEQVHSRGTEHIFFNIQRTYLLILMTGIYQRLGINLRENLPAPLGMAPLYTL